MVRINVPPRVVVEVARPVIVVDVDDHGALVEGPAPGPPYVWVIVDGRRTIIPPEHIDEVRQLVERQDDLGLIAFASRLA